MKNVQQPAYSNFKKGVENLLHVLIHDVVGFNKVPHQATKNKTKIPSIDSQAAIIRPMCCWNQKKLPEDSSYLNYADNFSCRSIWWKKILF